MRRAAAVLTVVFLLATASASEDYDFLELGATEFLARPPPDYLTPCHKNDSKLNVCIKSSLETLLTHITSGSKELNLPSLDPLQVPMLEVTEGSGNVSLRLTFRDLRILGLGQLKVLNVRSNIPDNKFEITVKTPYLDMIAQYSGEGGILSFPIAGQGLFNLNLSDVTAAWIIYLAQSDTFRRQSYFMVDQFLIDIIPTDISGHFGDVIDGDNGIGSAFNSFFNENAHEIFKSIKPKISGALGDIFGNVANQVLSRYPAEVLLPP